MFSRIIRPGLLIWLSLSFDMLSAKSYFVSGSGNDLLNNGRDTAHAFRTIGKAADLTNPGDTVFVMNGTYANTGEGAVVTITRSGTADAWIVYMAYPGHKPKISFNGWGAFYGTSFSYVEINGFEIIGNSDAINLDFAYANKASAASSGAGIYFRPLNDTTFPHHIRILNNSVSKCGGAGIGIQNCDFVTIDNNKVWGNAWYSYWATSGIYITTNANFDGNTAGYRMVVTRNTIYDNKCLISYLDTGFLKEGNGIVLDNSKKNSFSGRTLVANNIVYGNGGAGIHAILYEHTDIVNNTFYQNSQNLDYPTLLIDKSNDIKIENNIIYSLSAKEPNSSKNSTRNSYDFNIYFGGTTPVILSTNDKLADPLFVAPSIDPDKADFQLKNTSPALNSGKIFEGVKTDFKGISRPQGLAADIGAYEHVAGSDLIK